MDADDARRLTAQMGLRDDIEAEVAGWPPLSEDQRRALRAIFRPRPPEEGDGRAHHRPATPAA